MFLPHFGLLTISIGPFKRLPMQFIFKLIPEVPELLSQNLPIRTPLIPSIPSSIKIFLIKKAARQSSQRRHYWLHRSSPSSPSLPPVDLCRFAATAAHQCWNSSWAAHLERSCWRRRRLMTASGWQGPKQTTAVQVEILPPCCSSMVGPRLSILHNHQNVKPSTAL